MYTVIPFPVRTQQPKPAYDQELAEIAESLAELEKQFKEEGERLAKRKSALNKKLSELRSAIVNLMPPQMGLPGSVFWPTHRRPPRRSVADCKLAVARVRLLHILGARHD